MTQPQLRGSHITRKHLKFREREASERKEKGREPDGAGAVEHDLGLAGEGVRWGPVDMGRSAAQSWAAGMKQQTRVKVQATEAL